MEIGEERTEYLRTVTKKQLLYLYTGITTFPPFAYPKWYLSIKATLLARKVENQYAQIQKTIEDYEYLKNMGKIK